MFCQLSQNNMIFSKFSHHFSVCVSLPDTHSTVFISESMLSLFSTHSSHLYLCVGPDKVNDPVMAIQIAWMMEVPQLYRECYDKPFQLQPSTAGYKHPSLCVDYRVHCFVTLETAFSYVVTQMETIDKRLFCSYLSTRLALMPTYPGLVHCRHSDLNSNIPGFEL